MIGGQSEGALVGQSELITVDVGGTSCDIALISAAKALTRSEGVIDGYTVRVPMVDVNAIGAGGGSIAWLDDAGGLRVGPHSAGSVPGPACYGLGGEQGTVTDASVVLGLVNPEYFAGGSLSLQPELAAQVIRRCIAGPLSLSVEDAAAGIHEVLNAQMTEGIRLVSIGRGYDPREFALVALGGGGPVHACALAEELQISRIVLPVRPGVLSASGLLAAPVEHEASMSFGVELDATTMAEVVPRLGQLDARCAELMAVEGLLDAPVDANYFADLCYVGQGYYLEVPLNLEPDEPLRTLYKNFLEAHDRIYGHSVEGAVRFVNLRAVHSVAPASNPVARAIADTGRAPVATPVANRALAGTLEPSSAPISPMSSTNRTIRIPGDPDRCTARVYQRDALTAGMEFDGPAIIEQSDTTTLVATGWHATVATSGAITLRKSA